jgi:hypothetical protein
MATTVSIAPMQAFTRGAIVYAPRNIPVDATSVVVTLDRSAMTGDPVAKTGDARVGIAWSIFLSLDGGVSWTPWGGAGTVGGNIPATPTSFFTIALPDPTNPNRQVAAVFAVSGNITLAIDATVLP